MFVEVLSALNEGFLKTLELFGLTLAGALPLGLVIAFGSMSRFTPLKALVRTFVWIIRGTPLMLQLMIIYYFPGLIFGNNIWGTGEGGRFIASIAAFVLNYACYFSEIYRGGIQGVSKGQYEAGQVLGMTKTQVFFRVVLLQVIKRILPPISNEVITLVKDTSLARIIAMQEVIWAGQAFMKSDGIIWPLFFTGVYYLIFSGILTLMFGYTEKKLSYFRE
ncbi:MAG: amino acid ABC transporter permease [Clostridia bacterium]|nr:amino acid ABC transporter permease [Clostridia bacterium]